MTDELLEPLTDVLAEMRGFRNHPDAKKRVSGAFVAGVLFGLANRIEAALEPLLSIDLSTVSPLPWKSKAENRAIADTGDYMGLCYVVDKDGKDILDGDGDGPEEREVEIDGWYHDGNCVAAVACVNAVAQLQADFAKLKEAEG